MRRTLWALALAVGAVATLGAQSAGSPLSISPGKPASEVVPILRDVGIDQKLGNTLPLDAPFVDEAGQDVTIGSYVGTKPVVLVLAYFDCPMLCTQVINGMVGALMPMKFTAGNEFDVIVVSFNPGDTPAMATAKRAQYLQRYNRPSAGAGMHFLTGRQASIDRLTGAVGFRYAYDKAINQYAHPATIMVVTPDGRMSKYLFGIEYSSRHLQFALMEASSRRIGSLVDQALLFCYHYDPERGKYGFAILTAVRVGGLLTLVAIGAFILVTLRRERQQASAVSPTATGMS